MGQAEVDGGVEPPQIDAVDLEWVPVTEGGVERVVSLREALLRAHEFDGLGTLLPVEREAMLRFLESLAAAVLMGQDPEDLSHAGRVPADAVDSFFVRNAQFFILNDPDRPFLQEWHTGDRFADEAKKYNDIDRLHLRIPGASSKLWGVTPEVRDAADPSVVSVLLVTAWFHGKPSNSAAIEAFRPSGVKGKRTPVSGAPSGGPRDTTFHLQGENLATTLLMNLPRGWLRPSAGPAWLDQDAQPAPSDYSEPGTLWRSTWTANRPVVHWEGRRAVSYSRGVTMRFIPQVGPSEANEFAQLKSHSKAVADGDLRRVPLPHKEGQPAKTLKAPFNLRSTEGFEAWYSRDFGQALRDWLGRQDSVVPRPANAKVAFHNEEGDTYGNRKRSDWTVVPLSELTVSGPAVMDVLALLTFCQECVKAMRTAFVSEWDKDMGGTLAAEGRPRMYSSFDPTVLGALATAGAEKPFDLPRARADVAAAAIDTFDSLTATLRSPVQDPAVFRSRSHFARQVRKKEKDS